MPIAGVILGLVLAVWISVFTLFNDAYLQQPLMTGNLMPTSVYGPAVLLALLGGLGVRGLKRRQLFGPKDTVAMVVIATAACAWPGTNFLRTFVGTTGNVVNLAKTQDNWREAEVFDYAPPGVVLADGRDTPGVTDVMTTGADDPDDFSLGHVPWSAWWPVLRLWGGLALLLGLASVCLGVIVHPQWSRYERLPYPLVRFLEELLRPPPGISHAAPGDLSSTEDDLSKAPKGAEKTSGGAAKNSGGGGGILRNKLFWLGLGSVFALHLVNGLVEWGGLTRAIPLTYDLSPLQALFPNTNVHGAHQLYRPHLFFSVIAFTFFIRGDVAFSVGISNFVWVAASAAFVARGVSLGYNPIETEPGTLLRAGAYIGFAAMILYLGRRHYLRVTRGAFGLGRVGPDERAGVWATRGLLVCVLAAVWLMARYAQLDWRIGLLFVALSLVILLILARLSAETGMFYLEPNWVPLVVVVALLGFEGMGPTAFLVVALFSTAVIGVPREPLMGYVVNGLCLTQRVGGRKRIGGTGLGMAGIAVVTLGLAVAATLVLTYTRGLSPHETWANRGHPSLPFDALARRVADLDALGRLESVVAGADAGHFAAAVPDPGALGWLALGIALVVGCTLARLRLAWWPIHPVLFFMLGSMAGIRLAWSFLIGWAIRQAVVRLGGVKAYHAALPLAVGAIAGELLAALGWQACGVTYYLFTGLPPSKYFILPN